MTTATTMTTPASAIQALEAQHVLQTYKRQPVVFVRGDGCRIEDIDGRRYLDFVSGIGVSVLGHGHPGLSRAVAEQAAALLHTSNLYYHPLQGQVAARLAAFSGLPRTFFCNSGTEAMEACLKFARRYWFTQGVRGRTQFVAFEHGFSGRTMGALSVTANPHYREPFEPLIPGVTFVPPGDSAALEAAVSSATAAIVVEPIQGEGGVRPISAAFAAAIEAACTRTGALLIADEVQCGLGRTGAPFYFQTLGLTPDLVTVGKALGAGVPVGAALVAEAVAAQVLPGDHGTTYGGNLLATRAALFVLEQLQDHGLMEQVQRAGTHFEARLSELAATHPVITEIRGAGLMRGLQLAVDAQPVVEGALARGLLVNRTAESVVRLLPPYTVTEADIDSAVATLDAVLAGLPAEVQAK
jgi:acetylornithine/N-succinyldiaminopimelate aminotransferase